MVFAGNNPDLPDDTRSRCILIYLYPSDTVEDTDWELIERDDTYQRILTLIPQWAGQTQDRLTARPGLDPRVKGRVREKWLPLARVAQTLDDYPDEEGRPVSWLDTVRRLAVADVEQIEDDAVLGLRNSSPHTAILTDIARLWATQWADQPFIGSTRMCNALAATNPISWGTGSRFGTPITPDAWPACSRRWASTPPGTRTSHSAATTSLPSATPGRPSRSGRNSEKNP